MLFRSGEVRADPLFFHLCLSSRIVGCVQGYVYFTSYPKDPWHLKALVSPLRSLLISFTDYVMKVAAVLISDTVHQMLISHTSKPTLPPSTNANDTASQSIPT